MAKVKRLRLVGRPAEDSLVVLSGCVGLDGDVDDVAGCLEPQRAPAWLCSGLASPDFFYMTSGSAQKGRVAMVTGASLLQQVDLPGDVDVSSGWAALRCDASDEDVGAPRSIEAILQMPLRSSNAAHFVSTPSSLDLLLAADSLLAVAADLEAAGHEVVACPESVSGVGWNQLRVPPQLSGGSPPAAPLVKRPADVLGISSALADASKERAKMVSVDHEAGGSIDGKKKLANPPKVSANVGHATDEHRRHKHRSKEEDHHTNRHRSYYDDTQLHVKKESKKANKSHRREPFEQEVKRAKDNKGKSKVNGKDKAKASKVERSLSRKEDRKAKVLDDKGERKKKRVSRSSSASSRAMLKKIKEKAKEKEAGKRAEKEGKSVKAAESTNESTDKRKEREASRSRSKGQSTQMGSDVAPATPLRSSTQSRGVAAEPLAAADSLGGLRIGGTLGSRLNRESGGKITINLGSMKPLASSTSTVATGVASAETTRRTRLAEAVTAQFKATESLQKTDGEKEPAFVPLGPAATPPSATSADGVRKAVDSGCAVGTASSAMQPSGRQGEDIVTMSDDAIAAARRAALATCAKGAGAAGQTPTSPQTGLLVMPQGHLMVPLASQPAGTSTPASMPAATYFQPPPPQGAPKVPAPPQNPSAPSTASVSGAATNDRQTSGACSATVPASSASLFGMQLSAAMMMQPGAFMMHPFMQALQLGMAMPMHPSLQMPLSIPLQPISPPSMGLPLVAAGMKLGQGQFAFAPPPASGAFPQSTPEGTVKKMPAPAPPPLSSAPHCSGDSSTPPLPKSGQHVPPPPRPAAS